MGAEIGKLEEIILRKDTVKHLIELLKVVLSQGQNKMILTILEIFRHLTNEEKFYNYFQLEDPMSFLDDKSLKENKDDEIKSKANFLFESVIRSNNKKFIYTTAYDSEELKGIKSAPLKKQITFLKNFEDALQQNKIKLDQQKDTDLDNLIEVCKFDKYNASMESEESFSDFGDDSDDKDNKESEGDEEEFSGVSSKP